VNLALPDNGVAGLRRVPAGGKIANVMNTDDLIVVTGAGGFIGGHLVADLLRQGQRKIRAVDIKPLSEWFQLLGEVDNRQLDLHEKSACYEAAQGAAYILNLRLPRSAAVLALLQSGESR